ncbi:DUF4339 domain-containing protein [Prosthecobacter dejongeii]|uniref:GYF domain-containing protein n=1 Tax=Prosthecobacter dejongeii TaxID=48465 RepID=A0A7W7YHP2_9BACT|nr:DUF4339 domain-containing protein [Prosthecobacter dejongeii]MBB5036373.1 hypothetical protein [Prosthecobacter dejongeii]
MMHYHIHKDGQQVGPLTENEITTGVNSGRFHVNDLVWREGLAEWLPISSIFPSLLPSGISSPPVPPPVPVSQAEEKFGCKHLFGLVLAAIFGLVILVAMFGDSDSSKVEASLTEEQKANEAKRQAKDGNAIIANASEGTTLQKEQYEREHLGKRYFFKGNVTDVKSNRTITVILDTWNHANVTFLSEDVSSFHKDKVVYFSAIIEEFGTGMLVRHDLGEARMENIDNPEEVSMEVKTQEPVNPNIKGPKILDIQLGDHIFEIRDVFNKKYRSELQGEEMEMRRAPDNSAIICTTAQGLKALQKMGVLHGFQNAVQSSKDKSAALLFGALAGEDGFIGGTIELKTLKAPIIYADKDGIINKVLISPMAAQVFFGTGFMSNKEFASFMHSKYDLPDLEGELVEVSDGFTRQTNFETKYFGYSHSYSVSIDETKMFVIESIK